MMFDLYGSEKSGARLDFLALVLILSAAFVVLGAVVGFLVHLH